MIVLFIQILSQCWATRMADTVDAATTLDFNIYLQPAIQWKNHRVRSHFFNIFEKKKLEIL